MDSQITIRACTTPEDTAFFWDELRTYFRRDIFPEAGEELDYFCGEDYRAAIEALHARETDPLHYLLFVRDGRPIGFAMTVIYASEDAKQFILEFCVLPPYRGGGTGKRCAAALLSWGRERGAAFAELNADTAQRQRFWGWAGFAPNGLDEWGKPLMLLPPDETLPVTVQVAAEADGLLGLEQSYLAEIGEEPMTEEGKERLRAAVRDGRITFFAARRLNRPVGICSVSRQFSTFACGDVGVFEDFYIEPAFRKQGIARALAQAAQGWCRENGLASLSVCCAPCDEEMYQSLGFETRLGSTFACPFPR